jgi:nucleotide-binding universal stress UspA family protein
VVGYDGSGSSRHALAYAAGMARRLGRPLLLAYITSPSIFCEPLSGQVIAPIRDSDETHRWLLAELDEVCDREGLDVRIVTRQGSPARELAAAADEFGADALVIGAPARIWHQVAGSVPGWLARHAHCPVIVVPDAPRTDRAAHRPGAGRRPVGPLGVVVVAAARCRARRAGGAAEPGRGQSRQVHLRAAADPAGPRHRR